VYQTWGACEREVSGHPGSAYRVFKGPTAFKEAKKYMIAAVHSNVGEECLWRPAWPSAVARPASDEDDPQRFCATAAAAKAAEMEKVR